LAKYRNTVCGRHPIALLLNMLQHCSAKFSISTQFYDQSSKCARKADSSVSYAATIVTPA
jgi:predicted class III extradiol MEMO1 family dioxygenase